MYNELMQGEEDFQEYHPETLSRRGEFIAWALAIIVNGAWAFLLIKRQYVPAAMLFLGVFLLLAGLGISLSNWMDRKTVLRVYPDGMMFTNGLRNTRQTWDQIRRVQVLPSPWGKKVRVIGKNSYFEFRTLGEVSVRGQVKGRLGFAQGESILHSILNNAHLIVRQPAPSGGYYYSRE